MLELVKKFIEEIIQNFNFSRNRIGYDYDEDNDFYKIWHTDLKFDQNEENEEKVSTLMNDLLYGNFIYNFSFAYDYIKEQELKNVSNQSNQIIIEFSKGVSYLSTAFNGFDKEKFPKKSNVLPIEQCVKEDSIWSILDKFSNLDNGYKWNFNDSLFLHGPSRKNLLDEKDTMIMLENTIPELEAGNNENYTLAA